MEAEAYLDSEGMGSRLSAYLIYTYANLSLGRIQKAREGLDAINAFLSAAGKQSPNPDASGTAVSDRLTEVNSEADIVTLRLYYDIDKIDSSGAGPSGSSCRGSYTGPVGVYYADGGIEDAASDVTSGAWEQETSADGSVAWRFKLADGSYAVNRWIKALWNDQYLWYHMDENGYLQGGWFTDTDGNMYYLHPFHDGNFGYMYTGDHVIDGTAYSFSKGREQDGLPEGALIR